MSPPALTFSAFFVEPAVTPSTVISTAPAALTVGLAPKIATDADDVTEPADDVIEIEPAVGDSMLPCSRMSRTLRTVIDGVAEPATNVIVIG